MNELTANMKTEEAIKEKIRESRFESINGKDLMEMDLPPLHYTISTILPHGFFILAGGAMIKRRNNYEEDHAFPALLYPGDYVRPLPGGRSSSPQLQGVTDMEGIANFISMLDYVLDTKRKRHITGGLLLSGALLFGGLAMTVMSIRDDEEDEDE